MKLKSVMKIGDQTHTLAASDKKVKDQDGSVYILTGFQDRKIDSDKGDISLSKGLQLVDILEPSSCNKQKKDASNDRQAANHVPLFPGYGIVVTLISSAIFSVSTACVKEAVRSQEGMDGVTLAFYRGAIMCAVTAIVQLSRGQNIWVPRSEIVVNILRSIFGTGAVFGLYVSMKYITMGDATAISFSSPVWTYILSYFILKEKLHWLQIVSLPASIFGVLLIANPYLFIDSPDASITTLATETEELLFDGVAIPEPFNVTAIIDNNNNSNISMITQKLNVSSYAANQMESQSQDATFNNNGYNPSEKIYGTVMAFISSLCMSGAFIVLKFRKKTPVPTTIFWFGFTTCLVALVAMSSFNNYIIPSSLKVWLLIAGNGGLSFIAQMFFQVAFYYEDASIISLVKTVEVVMAFIITFLFFDDDIEWTSITGAVIIVTSVASLMLLKWYKSIKTAK